MDSTSIGPPSWRFMQDFTSSWLKSKTPVSEQDKKLVDNLMRIYGVRNVGVGLAIGITAYLGDVWSLAWIIISCSTMAIVDGIVSKDQIGRGEWIHWGFFIVSIGLGSALLGIFDNIWASQRIFGAKNVYIGLHPYIALYRFSLIGGPKHNRQRWNVEINTGRVYKKLKVNLRLLSWPPKFSDAKSHFSLQTDD